MHVAVLLCDFSRHLTLTYLVLNKRKYLGICRKKVNIFKSYFQNRYQAKHFNRDFSEFNLYQFGDPKGSILGAMLFLIYVNEFFKFPHTKHDVS